MTYTIVIDTDTGLLVTYAPSGNKEMLDQGMLKYLSQFPPEYVNHTFLMGEMNRNTMREVHVSVENNLLWTKEVKQLLTNEQRKHNQ